MTTQLQEPLLRVENLSVGIRRKKGNLLAVKDISFHIKAGEIAGIVGESGCGKSLTALSIPGLLPEAAEVTGGIVTLGDKNLLELSPLELQRIRGRDIAMIFQEPVLSLNPLIRIERQIAESLLLQGIGDKDRVKREILDIMNKLNLEEPHKLLRAYPHQLSGGMCQRVMIALAVIGKPRLLIADEPTTALDAHTQIQILALLEKVNKDFGTSILFISHDLKVVRRLCSRVMVMYAGKIVEEGPIDQVYYNPAHEYTRGLLGSIPSRERKGKALSHIPGKVPSIEEDYPGCPFAPRCAKAREECSAAFPKERRLGEERRTYCLAPMEE